MNPTYNFMHTNCVVTDGGWLYQTVGEHPDIGMVLTDLAGLYRKIHKLDHASELYERAVGVCERTLGDNNPECAWVIRSFAGLKRDLGKFQEAEELYQQCICVLRKSLGNVHPRVAWSVKLSLSYSSFLFTFIDLPTAISTQHSTTQFHKVDYLLKWDMSAFKF